MNYTNIINGTLLFYQHLFPFEHLREVLNEKHLGGDKVDFVAWISRPRLWLRDLTSPGGSHLSYTFWLWFGVGSPLRLWFS